MVLSRKRRQKLRLELQNNETNPETPKTEKIEIVTGKKRKRENKGSLLKGKLEVIEQNNGEKDDENKVFDEDGVNLGGIELSNKEKFASLKKKKKLKVIVQKSGEEDDEKKVLSEDGVDLGGKELSKEEKVVSLSNSDNKTKTKTKKKKKKKKVKKKKNKVDNEEVKKEVEVENVVVSEQIVQENSKGNDGDARKVYVGGMPYYSTEDDIRSYFNQCGAITEMDCMFFPETGKFRGIAILTFETEEAAEYALELDGSDMGGLYLKIEPYKTTRPTKTSDFSPPVIEGYNRIYAGNLSWDITEDDLRKLFSDCKISAIRFGEDKNTGDFKGYAHIDFADDASLNKALKLDQKFVCGRPVKISRAVPKKGAVVTNGASTSTTIKPQDNSGDNSVVTPENDIGVNLAITHENNVVNEAVPPPPPENKSGVSSGKLKRRTCYDCGERGHISSDCPKKQNS
ncbi:hypothetical protein RND81_03G102300 [Saponaria officinalis]|uniref:Uncharacterized protein n=1 Tax=Saponaria officinalis TaxID=3572 RepID=A0AAW1M7K1_SAPOF